MYNILSDKNVSLYFDNLSRYKKMCMYNVQELVLTFSSVSWIAMKWFGLFLWSLSPFSFLLFIFGLKSWLPKIRKCFYKTSIYTNTFVLETISMIMISEMENQQSSGGGGASIERYEYMNNHFWS